MLRIGEQAYKEIEERILPRVLEKFLAKGRDYGDAFALLGPRGQFSDINRKFWKLYRNIWLGKPLEGEQADEIAEDFIGHCLLLIWMLENRELFEEQF